MGTAVQWHCKTLHVNMNKHRHPIPNLFSDHGTAIKSRELFYYLFGKVGSIRSFHGCKVDHKLAQAFTKAYGSNRAFQRFEENDLHEDTGKNDWSYRYVLGDDLLVSFGEKHVSIHYCAHCSHAEAERVAEFVKKYIIKDDHKEPRFHMIFEEFGSLDLKEFNAKLSPMDIDTHYNDDFAEADARIKQFVAGEDTGVVLLHGKPGTGKTSYIRHLISTMECKFIYLPADMVAGLTRPLFLPFLLEHPNSVCIIEDCEELLAQRNPNPGQNITNNALLNLLNMSDGLIGDAVNIKFICTFNAPTRFIDEALLRKGRMVVKYEFKELVAAKANALAAKYKLSVPALDRPITLSELYHYDGQIQQARKGIGFK